MFGDQIQDYCLKYVWDEPFEAIWSFGCDTRTKIHSVSSVLVFRVKTHPSEMFSLKHPSGEQRHTQLIAPVSTVPTLNWKHGYWSRPLIFTEKPNAWLCCVCSTKRDSCYGCESQRLSSRMSCDCSSCRRSNCGSGSVSCSCSCFCSDSGWCCELGSDCGYVWRCCSTMTRWLTDCWRKDWVGSKGWVASWHCREQRLNVINLKDAHSFYPHGFVLVIKSSNAKNYISLWMDTNRREANSLLLHV